MPSIKRKYFLFHLTLSVLIVLAISLICQYLWFPSPFIFIDGTWVALLILAAVDITLGPLLTLLLIHQRKSKKEIFVDLFVIGILQISALIYGLVQIEKEQVLAIVHSDGAFNLVPKKELNANELSFLEKLPQFRGIYYGMVLNSDLLQHSKTSSKPLIYSPDMFQSVTKNEILISVFPYQKLPALIKEKYSSKYIFKGLAGKKQNAVIVFTENMELIDILLLPVSN